MSVSEKYLNDHLRVLAQDIGVRLSGSPSERQAADYIADQFSRYGGSVCVEEFPMKQRTVASEALEILLDGQWVSFPCSLFSSTPGTDGATVEAPLVFFEAPAEIESRDLGELTGRAVVHLGCHIESRDAYRRLIEAKPAFLLMVDIRYPGAVPLADGMFPAYTRDIGAVPTINVAYLDAWRWKTQGASSARVRVQGGMQESTSQNVIADLPGDGSTDEIVYMGAHHDTQTDSVGADDNATGVAGVLECARVLGQRDRKRAIRIISFGCEEQLSVGSATYVRAHRDELRTNGRFMFNLDSYGSHLGWNVLISNGPAELGGFLSPFFRIAGHSAVVRSEIMPYADHFPFVAAGVPSTTLLRDNCATGRFFHHRSDDEIDKVSMPLMTEILGAVTDCVATLSACEGLPFPNVIPKLQRDQVEVFWEDLFGGWE